MTGVNEPMYDMKNTNYSILFWCWAAPQLTPHGWWLAILQRVIHLCHTTALPSSGHHLNYSDGLGRASIVLLRDVYTEEK
jgi:hypothetical protein